MKKQIIASTLLLILFSHQAQAQSTVVKAIGCGVAVAQLINYANQVNGFYNAEFQTVIPNQRCPAVVPDPWGRPVYVNPIVVQNCRQQHLIWLNQWYAQQANYVDNWQGQIVTSCFTKPPKEDDEDKDEKPIAKRIDEKKLKELEIGVDEEKSLKITIPKTAEGFKPRP